MNFPTWEVIFSCSRFYPSHDKRAGNLKNISIILYPFLYTPCWYWLLHNKSFFFSKGSRLDRLCNWPRKNIYISTRFLLYINKILISKLFLFKKGFYWPSSRINVGRDLEKENLECIEHFWPNLMLQPVLARNINSL